MKVLGLQTDIFALYKDLALRSKNTRLGGKPNNANNWEKQLIALNVDISKGERKSQMLINNS